MKYGDLNLAVEWEVVRMIGRHQCQDASYHLLRVKYVVDKRWAQNITPRVTPAQSSGTKGEWVACFRWRGRRDTTHLIFHTKVKLEFLFIPDL